MVASVSALTLLLPGEDALDMGWGYSGNFCIAWWHFWGPCDMKRYPEASPSQTGIHVREGGSGAESSHSPDLPDEETEAQHGPGTCQGLLANQGTAGALGLSPASELVVKEGNRGLRLS